MQLGFHTDAFNTTFWSFEGAAGPMIEQSLDWLRQQCAALAIPLE